MTTTKSTHALPQELIEVHREYTSHRQSQLRRTHNCLAKLLPPQQMQIMHPLSQSLCRDISRRSITTASLSISNLGTHLVCEWISDHHAEMDASPD